MSNYILTGILGIFIGFAQAYSIYKSHAEKGDIVTFGNEAYKFSKVEKEMKND